jgi:hypothetical protein
MNSKLKYLLRWLTFLIVLIYFVFINSSFEIKDIIAASLLLIIISIGLWADYSECKKEKGN